MSVLIVDQRDDDVLLITDTLATTDDNQPFMFQSKVWTFPHLNMAAAMTGTGNLGAAWCQRITHDVIARDIEGINQLAPDALRNIHAALVNEFGDIENSTMYHFGFPEGSVTPVRYIYRSVNNFEPERYEGAQLVIKPTPPGFDLTYLDAIDEIEVPDLVDLACRLRESNDAHMLAGTGGVCIGGDLFATVVENWKISTFRVHRFPDYEEHLHAMVSGSKVRRAADLGQ